MTPRPIAVAIITITGALVGAVALGGCAGGATPTDVHALTVGDCLLDTAELETSQVLTVDCGQPHDSEVFHEFELDGGEYPADVQAIADERCIAAFDGFAGIAFDDSIYNVNHYTPTAGSWNDGDRAVDCLIYLYDEQVVGTLEGAKR